MRTSDLGSRASVFPPPQGVACWLGIVAALAAAGALVGAGVGQLLYHLSTDYVYRIGEYVDRGARAGLLAGTAAAAAAVVGSQGLPAVRPLVKCLVLCVLAVPAAGLLAGTGGYLLSRTGVLETAVALEWQVGNPNRVACCLGIEYGVTIGYWIALAAACLAIRRLRARPDT